MAKQIKLLLVEDDEVDQMAFKRLVASEGLAYDYSIAGSVAEAVHVLASERFAVVVLDLRLGDGTAFDVIPLMTDTPFIVVTGNGDENFAVKAMKAGAHDYLIKDLERQYLTLLPVTVAGAVKQYTIEKELHEKDLYIQSVHESIADGIVTVNEQGSIESVNPAVQKIFGYDAEEVVGQQINKLLPASFLTHDLAVCNYLHKNIIRFIDDGYEFVAKHKNGAAFPVEFSISEMWFAGRQLYIIVFKNISDRKQIELLLREQTLVDCLTGLGNKLSLQDILRKEISRSARYNHHLGLLMLDIDFFKKVNDTYGHQAGDEVLRSIAQLMQESLRTHDRAVRYGGEEFIIILPKTTGKGAATFAERLRLRIASALLWIKDMSGQDLQMHITVSIGTAIYPGDGMTADHLIASADKAMYAAKHSGRNCVVACSSEMQSTQPQ